MYKTLRILFCILACICAALTIFIFIYFGIWGLVPLLAGVVFAGLMILFKNKQELEERKLNPPAPEGDFITGRVPKNNKPDEEK